MAGSCRVAPGSEGRTVEAPGPAEYGEHGVARVFCRVGECRKEFVLRAGEVKGVRRASTSKQ
jgi:hypothetical protein